MHVSERAAQRWHAVPPVGNIGVEVPVLVDAAGGSVGCFTETYPDNISDLHDMEATQDALAGSANFIARLRFAKRKGLAPAHESCRHMDLRFACACSMKPLQVCFCTARTAVAVDAVEQLHRLANVVHVGGHAHEGQAGGPEELLGVLDVAGEKRVREQGNEQELRKCTEIES